MFWETCPSLAERRLRSGPAASGLTELTAPRTSHGANPLRDRGEPSRMQSWYSTIAFYGAAFVSACCSGDKHSDGRRPHVGRFVTLFRR